MEDHETETTADEQSPIAALTTRERQVAERLGYGDTNREVADRLEISVKTVDTHRGHILKKLGLRNNVALARLLAKIGICPL
jgi:DNA-binding CsgD family transcriptional regulator